MMGFFSNTRAISGWIAVFSASVRARPADCEQPRYSGLHPFEAHDHPGLGSAPDSPIKVTNHKKLPHELCSRGDGRLGLRPVF